MTIFISLFVLVLPLQAKNHWNQCALYYHEGDIPAVVSERSAVRRENMLSSVPWKILPQNREFSSFLDDDLQNRFLFITRHIGPLPKSGFKRVRKTSIVWIKLILPQSAIRNPTLFFPSVDHKFEIYSYGKRIYKFGTIGIGEFEGRPSHMIHLNRSHSRTLYFRFQLSRHNAMPYESPMYASYSSVIRHQLILYILNSAYIGLFVVMGIISCLFFVFSPSTRYFLFHGLSSLFVSVIVLMRGKILYHFEIDYLLIYYIQCTALYLFVIFMELFVSRYFKKGSNYVVNHFWLAYLLLVVLILGLDAVNVLGVETGYLIFEYTLIPTIIFFSFFLFRMLYLKIERMVAAGILLFFVFGAYDVIADITSIPNVFPLTETGYMVFLVAYFISGVKRIIVSRDRLEENNKELNTMNNELISSNRRNSIIIENSIDLYLCLDSSFRLIAVNSQIRRYLKNYQEGITHITELIYYENQADLSKSEQLMCAQLQLLVDKGEPVTMKATFRNIWTSEPEDLSLRFEMISSEKEGEILCCGKRAVEDHLNRYFVYEKQMFEITNHLMLAEDLSYRVTRNMVRYLPQRQVNIIRIALREIIANAIEHGNLGITFEEKTRYGVNPSEYLEFINERKSRQPYSDRKVHVQFSIKRQGACYEIWDEGDGFDYEKALQFDLARMNEESCLHGRGLRIANEIFDRLIFTQGGRKVTAIKMF